MTQFGKTPLETFQAGHEIREACSNVIVEHGIDVVVEAAHGVPRNLSLNS
jgi:hypothetical protein